MRVAQLHAGRLARMIMGGNVVGGVSVGVACWQEFEALRIMGAIEMPLRLGDESADPESWDVLQERWRLR